MQVKNRTLEQKHTGVVYEIPCTDCTQVYVGEKLRGHWKSDQVNIDKQWNEETPRTVQRRAEGFWLRRTVEAIQIRKATLNMNLDSGLLLPMVWNPILNPLSPIDAYLRQIIDCVKGPLTHICVKGEGAHFNHPFGCYKWAMPMSISVQA